MRAKKLRVMLYAAWLVSNFAVLIPKAQAQTATVDQVLAALAEVLKDRGERVAAKTVARQVAAGLCGQTLELEPSHATHSSPKQACQESDPAKTSPARRTLWLGGSSECRSDARACTADDVFVKTCRLVQRESMRLTDVYLLKTLSQEAVELLLRISGAGLDAERSRELGLASIAQYVHAVMEQLARGESAQDLAEPTLELADQLSTDLADRVLGSLARSAEAKGALKAVRAWIKKTCASAESDPACALIAAKPEVWLPEVLRGDQVDVAACARYFADESIAARRQLYLELFAPRSEANRDAPFARADEKSCRSAGYSGAALQQCQRARVILNLSNHLHKVVCHANVDDPRKSLRQLAYALAERSEYQEVLGSAGAQVDAYFARANRSQLSDVPREELAYGVRALGAALRAYRDDPVATERWLTQLEADIGVGQRKGVEALHAVLNAPSLDTQDRPASAPVAALRDSVKDFLTLPSLHLRQEQAMVDASMQIRSAVLSLLRRLAKPAPMGAAVRDLADYVSGLGRLSAELQGREVRAGKPCAQPGADDSLAELPSTLEQVSHVLRLAADRDWVGLALQLSDEVRMHAAPSRALSEALTFIRVLLSMYQAASVDEAKAIFEAMLEDESSREGRFAATTIDVAGLLAARGGYQRSFGTPEPAAGALYGLYAPVGVQVAHGMFGLMVYPIDVGAYLVESPAPGTRWPDALRLGASLYLRPWDDVPVAFGAGADYHPRIDSITEWRYFGFAALELPLYVIH